MKKNLLTLALFCTGVLNAQLNPAITNWLINTSGLTGSHYVQGNSTPIADNVAANVQTVQYSTNFVYVSTTGIPAYITGPFLDGNPSLATNQNAIFKLSLNPTANTGTLTSTTGGNIGIFVNGVALFDYRDGVAWNTQANALCGGPGNPPCPGGPNANMPWNRDAVPAEKAGFDCSKGHPAMGNYHHHQNPSAFKLDLQVISTICDVYDADGLYAIDATQHSPLIGFAYDGFPIYGAYGFKNSDGTGGITRIQSSYQLRNISVRTHWADGTDVADGPAVSSTYPLGYFREDYEFIAHTGQEEYLDASNGRFCVTPEYPNGTYCYFATVDENWNSAYPYVVGPKFHGVVTGAKVTSITEPVTTYSNNASLTELTENDWQVWPNPTAEIAMVQVNGLTAKSRKVALFDPQGRLVMQKEIAQGSTIVYFEIDTLYQGIYLVKIEGDSKAKTLIIQ
jgi:YHYH protein/Secretion system C-terminal sorting domain